MNWKNEEWQIKEILDVKQREIFFITCEALGIPIYFETRLNISYPTYPRLIKRVSLIGRREDVGLAPDIQIFSYEEALEDMRKQIAEQVNLET